VNEIEIYIHSG